MTTKIPTSIEFKKKYDAVKEVGNTHTPIGNNRKHRERKKKNVAQRNLSRTGVLVRFCGVYRFPLFSFPS